MKVKLASKQPVEALRGKLVHEGDLFCTSRNWSFKQRKQFKKRLTEIADQTLTILKDNVTVNGKDWSDTQSTEAAVEPFNPTLQVDLTALIVKVNDSIVNVTQKRKSVPPRIAAEVKNSLDIARAKDEIEALPLETEQRESMLRGTDGTASLASAVKSFNGSIGMLSSLGKMFPDLVNKANKVAQVSEEMQLHGDSSVYRLLKSDAKVGGK